MYSLYDIWIAFVTFLVTCSFIGAVGLGAEVFLSLMFN